MKKILVVGKHSFIGSHFASMYSNVDLASYNDLVLYPPYGVDIRQYDVVVCCALDPLYRIYPYQDQNDIDFKVAKKAKEANVHFIMLSTRRVYGMHSELKSFDENCLAQPFDNYSKNKFITENIIGSYLDNYTILRCSNVFGFEYKRNFSQSFLGYCLNSLKQTGKIMFEASDDLQRDFIHVNEFCRALYRVCERKTIGTFNVGSGVGLSVTRVPELIIKGYGSGELVKGTKVFDQFILNQNKFTDTFDFEIAQNFEKQLIDIGKQLCKI